MFRRRRVPERSGAPSAALPPGAKAPDFQLPSASGEQLSLSTYRGRPVVLVFYPADWSPVCGDQLALYNEVFDLFEAFDAQVLAISVDGTWCHRAFADDRNEPRKVSERRWSRRTGASRSFSNAPGSNGLLCGSLTHIVGLAWPRPANTLKTHQFGGYSGHFLLFAAVGAYFPFSMTCEASSFRTHNPGQKMGMILPNGAGQQQLDPAQRAKPPPYQRGQGNIKPHGSVWIEPRSPSCLAGSAGKGHPLPCRSSCGQSVWFGSPRMKHAPPSAVASYRIVPRPFLMSHRLS